MEPVGEVGHVIGPEQLEPVEVVEVGVARVAPLVDDLLDDLAAPRRAVMLPMRDSRDASTVRQPVGPSAMVGPGVSSVTGKTIDEATRNGVSDARRARCRGSRAARDGSARSRIESKLITFTPTFRLMKIRGLVADGAGDELVEVAAPTEREVEEVDVGAERDDRRPRGRGRGRLDAVADRAPVMHPPSAGRAAAGDRRDLGVVVDAEGQELDARAVR